MCHKIVVWIAGVLLLLVSSAAAAQTPAPRPGLPKAPSEAVARVSAAFDSSYRVGDFKSQAEAYETRKRLARKYAPLFKVSRLNGGELLSLADLYTYAEQFAEAEKALTAYLSAQGAAERLRARENLLGVQMAQKEFQEAYATAEALLDEPKYDYELVTRVQSLTQTLRASAPREAGRLAEKALPKLLEYAAANKERLFGAVATMLETALDAGSAFRESGEPQKAEAYTEKFFSVFNSSDLAADEKLRRLIGQAALRLKLVGSAAPAVEGIEYLDMPETRVPDMKGKVVLLDFMAHWCPPCVGDLPYLGTLEDKYKAKGLTVILVTEYYGFFADRKDISREIELSELKKLKAEKNFRYGMIVGPSTNREAYGVSGYPALALIDRAGRVRFLKQGAVDKGGLERMIEELLAESPPSDGVISGSGAIERTPRLAGDLY
jgi:thiol-disulfide isomerase/thioredoxin